jgi:hypothetical protein
LRFQQENWSNPEAHYCYPPEDDVYALGVTAYYLVTGTYPLPSMECGDDPERARRPRRLRPSELSTVHPALEALILRMLSEKPEERGKPGELAEAMVRAAQRAGPEADLRIQPLRSKPPSERAARTRPPRWYGLRMRARRLALVAAVAAVVLLMLLHSRQVLSRGDAPETGIDGRTVGLVDGGVEALAAAAGIPHVGMPAYALAMPMPKKPLPGQRKPPCNSEVQKAISGACWAGPIGTKRPPCGKDAFDHDDGCYLPVFDVPKPNTSEQP